MKKSVAVGVGIVVLGAAYVGATAWTGQKVASTYKDAIAKVQAQYPMLKITQQSYDKHLFSATSTMTVQFGCEPGESDPETKPFKLTLIDTIHDGPFADGTLAAATIDTELVLTPEVQANLAQMFGNAKPISAHTKVGFDGGYSSTVVSPAGKIALPDAHVVWKGLTLTASTDSSHRTVDFSFKLPGAEMTHIGSGNTVKFAGFNFQGSAKAVTELGLLRVGKSSGTLESVEINEPKTSTTPVKLLLSDLKFTDSSAADKDLFSDAFTLIAAGMLNDTKIDKIDLRTSVKNIHVPTYERIVSTVMKAPQCGPDVHANAMAMIEQIQKDLVAMLPHNPGVRLDKLEIEVDGKKAEMSAALDVQGITAADTQPLSIPLLMENGSLAVDLKLPVTWLQQIVTSRGGPTIDAEMANLMLQDITTKGFVVRDGDDIKSSVKFSKGQLVLNGKPVPMGGSAH